MKLTRMFLALIAALCLLASAAGALTDRPRAGDLGITVGTFETGSLDAITDVAGVRVGSVTIIEGDDVRTGVTAILPHGGNIFQEKVRAAIAVGNGFGKLVGLTQVRELGLIETPIVLTNTLSVFEASEAIIRYTLDQPGNEDVRSVNPVAGECNDGWLNDIRGFHVKQTHVLEAITTASDGEVAEGAIGAGTGTRCLGYKGGIGSSSRLVPIGDATYTLGVLVQTNFGGSLRVLGVPVGRMLMGGGGGEKSEGSCMIVLATDAPLSSRSLERLARRTFLGLARTGSIISHGSGDYAIAFSTAYTIPYKDGGSETGGPTLRDDRLTALFAATVDATEEAVYNSMLRAVSMKGREGHSVKPVPIDALMEALRSRGALP